MDNILEVKNINLKYKNFQINNISFSLPTGYVMALTGHNGAGKTTLMNMITNKITKYDGEIRISGKNTRDNLNEVKAYCSYISENAEFFRTFTVTQNADIYKLYYKDFDMDIFRHYVKLFGVPLNTFVGKLSKGTFIKFQLAFAAAKHTTLYIMDEPTAGLDPVFRKDFITHLQTLVANEIASILISSHNLTDLDLISDYVTLIENGSLVYTKEHLTNKRRDYSDFTGTNAD